MLPGLYIKRTPNNLYMYYLTKSRHSPTVPSSPTKHWIGCKFLIVNYVPTPNMFSHTHVHTTAHTSANTLPTEKTLSQANSFYCSIEGLTECFCCSTRNDSTNSENVMIWYASTNRRYEVNTNTSNYRNLASHVLFFVTEDPWIKKFPKLVKLFLVLQQKSWVKPCVQAAILTLPRP